MNDTISDAFLGKHVADLQSGVKFSANGISGTLKYIENWTDFSSLETENTGYFLAFKSALANADKITVQLIGAKTTKGVQELDADGIAVFHITDPKSQMVQVVAYKDGKLQQKLYSLRGLTFQEA